MKRWIYAARSSSAYKKADNRSTSVEDNQFSKYQLDQIERGKEAGLDVSVYTDPKFDAEQMREIRLGLEKGVDVSLYADPKFDAEQMEEIREGLRSGVDVSIYADPKFDWGQMSEIRLGLEEGVDISLFADPKFEWKQMWHIRRGLESGVDVRLYADPKFNWKQMGKIRNQLEHNLPLDYDNLSKSEKAKARWAKVKQAAESRKPLDIPTLEEEFDLGTLEGRAAYTLGLEFNENEDNSVTFTDSYGEVGTITADQFDTLVRDAIANSSTRSAFSKAFATRLKRALGLH